MRRAKAVAVGVLVVAAAAAALAQQMSQDAMRAISRTDAATARIDRETTCLRDKRDRLARFAQLIREADTQARTQTGRAHDDALSAITSLERQAADVDRQARACPSNEPSPFPSEVTQTPVTHVTPPVDPHAAEVAQPLGSTHVVEQNAALTEYVRVLRAEQVDGMGHVDDGAVRSAVHGVAGRFQTCYDRFVDRGALRSGQMALVFTIDGVGGLSHVTVEGDTLGDAALEHCVQSAGRTMRPSQGAYGGSATFSYTLRFGSE